MRNLLRKNNLYLVGIIALAFGLRVVGVNYGLPLFFQGDENSFIGSVDGLRFNSSINRFDWPHTSFYIHRFFHFAVYAFRVVLLKIGLGDTTKSFLPWLWEDPSIFYITTRFVNVIFASLTAIPLYLTSKNLFKEKVYWFIPSLIFVLIPFNVLDATRGVLDTEMTLWLSFFLYYCVLISKSPTAKNFTLAGVFMGLALGTKYYAGFYLLVFIIAILYSVEKEILQKKLKTLVSLSYVKKYLLIFVSFLVSLLAFNFQMITDFDLFWSKEFGKGFLFQFDNVKKLPWSEFSETLYKVSFFQPLNDYGLILFSILFLSVLLYLFFTSYRNKVTNLSIPLIVFVYLYFSTQTRNPSHYFVLVYPLAVLVITDFIKRFSTFFPVVLKELFGFKISKEIISYLLIGIVFVFSLYNSLLLSYKLSQPDTRNIANDWVENESDKNIRFYYYGEALESLPFYDVKETKITRLDNAQIDVNDFPYYIIIGIQDVDYESLVVNMSHPDVSGWTSQFLTRSDLEIYIDNAHRFGPPIYIFKVTEALRK